MNEVVIKENKKKAIEIVILGSIMGIASIYVLLIGLIEIRVLAIIIGLIATILFSASCIFVVKRIVNPKPLLLITESGITDMSTACGAGFIAWEEIQSINVKKSFTQEFIAITVYDLNKLMRRISSHKQVAMKMNLMLNYPPVAISLNTADIELNEVVLLIQKRLEEHRTNSIE